MSLHAATLAPLALVYLVLSGCSSAPSTSVTVTEGSISARWVQVTGSAWERNIVQADPEASAPPGPSITPPLQAMPTAKRITAPSAARQPAARSPAPVTLRAAPRPTASPRTDKQREQALVRRYAEGDDVAAVELARMLYAQGRTETGDMVLDFAVRKQNRAAIALKAERLKSSGG